MKKPNMHNNMKTLGYSDIIEVGLYAGSMLKTVLAYYGKMAFLEILKYYNVDDDIMKEYHCHMPATKEEKMAWEQKKTSKKVHMKSAVHASKKTSEDVLNAMLEEYSADPVVSATTDSEDDSWENYGYYCDVMYDPEDDPSDTFYGGQEEYPMTYTNCQYRMNISTI